MIPLWYAAVMSGLRGWTPAFDSAMTVVRAYYSFGANPSLVGVYAMQPSEWLGTSTYMPGPWLLWWLAIPVRTMGTTWGPLLAMALLNTLWFVLAGWFVKRRIGYGSATLVMLFLGLFTWSISNTLMLSVVPLVMVIPGFAAFCFGAWALASGDEGVLPLLAILGNFLLQDEMVLTIVLLGIAVAAGMQWVFGLWWLRRQRFPDWDETWRRSRRAILLAACASVVMWIPAMIQQLATSPGNLTLLVHAVLRQPERAMYYERSLTGLVSLIGQPPFWLRGSIQHSALMGNASGFGLAQSAAVVLALVAVASLIVLRSWRRRDRPALTAMTLAGAGFMAAWGNQSSGMYMGLDRYFLSSWVIAMFITFALGYGIARSIGGPIRAHGIHAAVILAVIVCFANFPHSNAALDSTTEPSDIQVRNVKELNAIAFAAIRGHGRVEFVEVPEAYREYAAIAGFTIALQNAGIPYCLNEPAYRGSPVPRCTPQWGDVRIMFASKSYPRRLKHLVGEVNKTGLSQKDSVEFEKLTDRIAHGLRAQGGLGSPEQCEKLFSEVRLERADEDLVRRWTVRADPGPMASPKTQDLFRFIIQESKIRNSNCVKVAGTSDELLLRWASLELRARPAQVIQVSVDFGNE